MLYLLGGTPRAGKSFISRKIHQESQIPYFSLDFLMMGLAGGAPEFGVDPLAPLEITGERLWPIVQAMCVSIINIGVDYLLEGCQLLPKFVHELLTLYPSEVKACYIGFTDISPEQKLKAIRDCRGLPNDWVNVHSDQEILDGVPILIKMSETFRIECEKFNIPYFDTSNDFTKTVEMVMNYLIRK